MVSLCQSVVAAKVTTMSTSTQTQITPKIDAALTRVAKGKSFIRVDQFSEIANDAVAGNDEAAVLLMGALITHEGNEVMPISAAVDILLDIRLATGSTSGTTPVRDPDDMF